MISHPILRRVIRIYMKSFKNRTLTQEPFVIGRACTLELDKYRVGQSPLADPLHILPIQCASLLA